MSWHPLASLNHRQQCNLLGSCAAPDPSKEDTHTNIPYQCEIYVDEEVPLLLIIGKVYKLRSSMHHQTLDEDHMRVLVK
ncbi:hypothetical protein CR513_56157, partial [Mucuna pruriens]